MIIKYKITEEDIIKDFLEKQKISRRLGKKIKLYGKMYINGEIALNWYKIKPGDELTIEYHESSNDQIFPSDKNIDIVYEDDYLMIVNKPVNLSTQPSKRHYEDNLISRVKAYYLKKNINTNIHIVNRLDFSTSGILIIAKEGYIHHSLYNTEIEKKYLAVVEGIMESNQGVINLKISKEEGHAIKRTVSEEGQEAITEYRILKRFEDKTLVEVKLITGRCHQIRVHMSTINHPVVGDKLYGKARDILYLHSYYLRFIHPITKVEIEKTVYPDWY